MDHDTAIKTQAAERYALDEMQAEEGLEFEEHFFECEHCAADVRAATEFQANARAWFEQHNVSELRKQPEKEGFWTKWRLVWLSPAFATLFAGLAGYSWLVTIPGLRSELASRDAVEAYRPTVLRAQTRSDVLPQINVKPGAPATFTFNVESEREYRGYEVEVLSPSGARVARLSVPAWPTVALRLPGALVGNGTYTVIVRGSENDRSEIGKYQFEARIVSR